MSDFHFIRPLWLIAIPVVFLIVYLLKKQQFSESGWQQFIPEHLSKVLIDGESTKKANTHISLLFVGIVAITALAGPTWQKLPQPVFQLEQGSVLIMDMSYSMYATDISPNRLTRSRYKADDLLTSINEGEIGLIAYAGDAFNISPLTKDINNIKLLLDSLSPDIMPVAGSNPLAALAMADDMLINAGHVNGHIYWLTDGIDSGDLQDITQWTRNHPHRLNVLGIGTKNGAPIKLPNGELLKDNSGAIVVPKLSVNKLYSAAQTGRGTYQTITNNASDINALVDFAKNENSDPQNDKNKSSKDDDIVRGDKWHEVGPWLVLLILPFALFSFRRGVLFSLVFTLSYVPSPHVSASIWDDLWKTDNQQAQEKFAQENFQEAAEQFKDSQWQGSAHYKNGDYEKALKSFKQSETAQALYNQGNSYAQLQQLDEAIAAYSSALEKDPNLKQASENKALLEKLKKQQEQQESENGDSDSDSENQSNQDNQQQNDDQQGDSQENQNGEQQQNQDESQQQGASEDTQSNADSDSEGSENNNAENESEEQKEQEQAESDKSQEQDEDKDSEQKADAAESEQGAADGSQEPKTAAQLAEEQKAKETEQKHQQLLNKVTNDPYLLLRNKMQLEYQKRRHEQSSIGEKKKW